MTLYKAKRKPSYNDCNAPKEICRCEGVKLNQRYVTSGKKFEVQAKTISFAIMRGICKPVVTSRLVHKSVRALSIKEGQRPLLFNIDCLCARNIEKTLRRNNLLSDGTHRKHTAKEKKRNAQMVQFNRQGILAAKPLAFL